MINMIPFVGWIISALAMASLAVPFWFLWTACELGTMYFGFLPDKYQTLPFFHCVGLFIVISILKVVLIPRLTSVSQKVISPNKDAMVKFIEKRIEEARKTVNAGGIGDNYDVAIRDLEVLKRFLAEYILAEHKRKAR